MKHLLFSLLIAGYATAQTCPAGPCSPENTVHVGFQTNKPFIGNQCIRGTGVIESGSSFSDYSYLSFSDSVIVDVPLNFTGGSKKLYLRQYVYIENIELDGNDTIYNLTEENGGLCAIRNATLTGKTILYTRDHVWIAGQYYLPGSNYNKGAGTISLLPFPCGALALKEIVRPVFKPRIEYPFIITPYYGGRQERKTCTIEQLSVWLKPGKWVIQSGGISLVKDKK